jgi:hypothetical protein
MRLARLRFARIRLKGRLQHKKCALMTLKVLSSEMDLLKLGSFDRSLLKREARRFLEKSARPRLWEPVKDSAPSRTADGN